MEHPKLTPEEEEIVERTRVELSQLLLRKRIPAERWAHVTLGVVVDLSGQVLKLHERDTEPPALLCGHQQPSLARSGTILHCTLQSGHAGAHSLEAWPP
jgi:hypothetical protein